MSNLVADVNFVGNGNFSRRISTKQVASQIGGGLLHHKTNWFQAETVVTQNVLVVKGAVEKQVS
jgi:hypothetical protein